MKHKVLLLSPHSLLLSSESRTRSVRQLRAKRDEDEANPNIIKANETASPNVSLSKVRLRAGLLPLLDCFKMLSVRVYVRSNVSK